MYQEPSRYCAICCRTLVLPDNLQPTCHVNHLPPFVEKYEQFKSKGVNALAFVAANDAFVMSAWGRVVGAQDKARLFYGCPLLRLNPAIYRFCFCRMQMLNSRRSSVSLWICLQQDLASGQEDGHLLSMILRSLM